MGVFHAAAEPGSTAGAPSTKPRHGSRNPGQLNGRTGGCYVRFGGSGRVGPLQCGREARSGRGQRAAPSRRTCTGWSSRGTSGEAVDNGRAPGPLLSRAARAPGGDAPRELARATRPTAVLARARCRAPARLHLTSSRCCCPLVGRPGVRHGRRAAPVAATGTGSGPPGSSGRSAAPVRVRGATPASCRHVPDRALLGCGAAARGSAGRRPSCGGAGRPSERGRSCPTVLRRQPLRMTIMPDLFYFLQSMLNSFVCGI